MLDISLHLDRVDQNITVEPLQKGIWLFHNVLSKEECDYLISMSEKAGYMPLPSYSKNYRNNDRVIIRSFDLAKELYTRCKDYFPQSWTGYDNVHELNEVFRFCRYTKGGIFRKHTDSFFERNSLERSRLTFNIYLNGGFDGGHTVFPENDIHVIPKPGMVLVFDHDIVHQGYYLETGKKYLARSDVMYKKT